MVNPLKEKVLFGAGSYAIYSNKFQLDLWVKCEKEREKIFFL